MKMSTFVAAALMLGAAPLTSTAQQAGQSYETRKVDPENANRNYADDTRNNRNDQVTPKGLMRASELMSVAVYNSQDEQIGVINDVVVDTQAGEIKYVALSTGGFLGLGDELHAVPWKAFKCEQRDGEHVAVLNVNQEKLENAEGFDQNNWPNMADNQWRQQNDRQYQSDASQRSTQGGTPRTQRMKNQQQR